MSSYKIYLFLMMCLFAFALSSSHAVEMIVDNSDPSVTVSGAWTTDTSNCFGDNKFTHGQGSDTDKVTWTASLPSGWYIVYFRMNTNTTYATDARYTIVHRDGTADLTVNQQRDSTGWFVLGGAYYFDGGTTVTLSAQFTSGDVVVADALQFWSVFSFVQMSDSHVGYTRGTDNTIAVVNELKTQAKVPMGTYGFDAPPPSFALHSGDFTEYGQEYWSTLMGVFSDMPFNVYFSQGNHDSTWSSCKERLKEKYGKSPYAFDHYDRGERYHFACLNSTVIQSPRGSFSREELDWLEQDLGSLEPDTPVFLNFHHPINGASDPKPFDSYRLLEALRPFRVLAIFYGHGHSFNQTTFDSVRIIQGGSTYNDSTDIGGYNVIAVTPGRIYVAKKIVGDAAGSSLLNMTIPGAPVYLRITVSSPAKDSILKDSTLTVTASISGTSNTITAVDFEWNGDDVWRPLSGSGMGPYTGNLDLSSAVHGRHWIRVRFTMDSGGPWYKMAQFWHWDDFPKARWIVDLEASSLSMPAINSETVYVGSNGGSLLCLRKLTGQKLWKYEAPSDVVSSPDTAGGRVVFGCGDSKVYCLDAKTGEKLWDKTCAGPVYGPPTIDGNSVFIGTIGSGEPGSRYLYSLDLYTGNENWKFPTENAIEMKPAVLDNAVFFGAWDTYFYAVDAQTGIQKWRYRRNSNRYYSPGDSWPAASNEAGMVFVADRQYYLSAINISTGIGDWVRPSVSSQGLTPDGKGILQRLTTGNLERTVFDNTTPAEWSANASLDSAPVAPISRRLCTAIVNQDGLVTVLNLDDGTIVYQFQIGRGYELHPVNIDVNGDIYASTYEGFALSVTNNDLSNMEAWSYY